MAREAMQSFYGKNSGWLEEGLIAEDLLIVKWRELCHQHNRGLQLPKHIS
jgi:carbazole 1,9a-dioxygenase terminal dioxygenase component